MALFKINGSAVKKIIAKDLDLEKNLQSLFEQNLEEVLKNVENILKPGGRVAIISFHSLEDRLVKNYFKKYAKEEKMEILTKKPIIASRAEIVSNPRSRSAKLRAARIL